MPGSGDAAKDKGSSLLVPSIANFSAQYNLQSIAIALVLMNSEFPNDDDAHTWVKSIADSVVFAGAVTGQLILGVAGDLMGRDNAMLLTLSFTAIGALASALASWGSTDTVYVIICASRFLLGMGVGGVYPLSATKAMEEASQEENATQRVSWAFFWQTPGVMGPYCVALLMYAITSDPSWRFRMTLGIGSLPAFIVLAAEAHSRSTTPSHELAAAAKPTVKSSDLWKSIWQREYWWKLAGTGGTWFLWDFLYYGTTLASPAIMKDIFGQSDSVLPNCWQNIVAAAMGIPGVLAAVWMIPSMGSRMLQIYGFWLLALCYVVMGILFQVDENAHALLFVIYCFLQFALNWGPNLSTFVLPAETFPTEVRCTFNGASACMGKLGALVGTAVFKPIKDACGMHVVFYICTAVCILSVVATHFLIEPPQQSEDVEEGYHGYDQDATDIRREMPKSATDNMDDAEGRLLA